MTRLLVLAALVGAAVFAAPGATAKPSAPGGTKAPSFGGDVVLPGGQGAEPSMAIDTSPTASRGNIYVAAIGDRTRRSSGTRTTPARAGPSRSRSIRAASCAEATRTSS